MDLPRQDWPANYKWGHNPEEGTHVFAVRGGRDGRPYHRPELERYWGRPIRTQGDEGFDTIGGAQYKPPEIRFDGALVAPGAVYVQTYYGRELPGAIIDRLKELHPGAEIRDAAEWTLHEPEKGWRVVGRRSFDPEQTSMLERQEWGDLHIGDTVMGMDPPSSPGVITGFEEKPTFDLTGKPWAWVEFDYGGSLLMPVIDLKKLSWNQRRQEPKQYSGGEYVVAVEHPEWGTGLVKRVQQSIAFPQKPVLYFVEWDPDQRWMRGTDREDQHPTRWVWENDGWFKAEELSPAYGQATQYRLADRRWKPEPGSFVYRTGEPDVEYIVTGPKHDDPSVYSVQIPFRPESYWIPLDELRPYGAEYDQLRMARRRAYHIGDTVINLRTNEVQNVVTVWNDGVTVGPRHAWWPFDIISRWPVEDNYQMQIGQDEEGRLAAAGDWDVLNHGLTNLAQGLIYKWVWSPQEGLLVWPDNHTIEDFHARKVRNEWGRELNQPEDVPGYAVADPDGLFVKTLGNLNRESGPSKLGILQTIRQELRKEFGDTPVKMEGLRDPETELPPADKDPMIGDRTARTTYPVTEGSFENEWEDNEGLFVARRPWIMSNGEIYLGAPGSHHEQIGDEFGIYPKEYGGDESEYENDAYGALVPQPGGNYFVEMFSGEGPEDPAYKTVMDSFRAHGVPIDEYPEAPDWDLLHQKDFTDWRPAQERTAAKFNPGDRVRYTAPNRAHFNRGKGTVEDYVPYTGQVGVRWDSGQYRWVNEWDVTPIRQVPGQQSLEVEEVPDLYDELDMRQASWDLTEPTSWEAWPEGGEPDWDEMPSEWEIQRPFIVRDGEVHVGEPGDFHEDIFRRGGPGAWGRGNGVGRYFPSRDQVYWYRLPPGWDRESVERLDEIVRQRASGMAHSGHQTAPKGLRARLRSWALDLFGGGSERLSVFQKGDRVRQKGTPWVGTVEFELTPYKRYGEPRAYRVQWDADPGTIGSTTDQVEEELERVGVMPGQMTLGASKADHDGAMVALFLPKEVGEKLEVEDGEPVEDMHITLAYFEAKAADRDDWDDLRPILERIANETPVLEGTINGFGVFQNDPDVLWAVPSLRGLADLRQRVAEACEDAGFPLNSEHDWAPHITLKYEGSMDDAPDLPVSGLDLRIDELTLMIGDDPERFDFEGEGMEKLTYERVMDPKAWAEFKRLLSLDVKTADIDEEPPGSVSFVYDPKEHKVYLPEGNLLGYGNYHFEILNQVMGVDSDPYGHGGYPKEYVYGFVLPEQGVYGVYPGGGQGYGDAEMWTPYEDIREALEREFGRPFEMVGATGFEPDEDTAWGLPEFKEAPPAFGSDPSGFTRAKVEASVQPPEPGSVWYSWPPGREMQTASYEVIDVDPKAFLGGAPGVHVYYAEWGDPEEREVYINLRDWIKSVEQGMLVPAKGGNQMRLARTTLYHAAPTELRDKILERGLVPQPEDMGKNWTRHIWMFDDPLKARAMAHSQSKWRPYDVWTVDATGINLAEDPHGPYPNSFVTQDIVTPDRISFEQHDPSTVGPEEPLAMGAHDWDFWTKYPHEWTRAAGARGELPEGLEIKIGDVGEHPLYGDEGYDIEDGYNPTVHQGDYVSAWIGVHQVGGMTVGGDGLISGLEVVPEYQRMGIATEMCRAYFERTGVMPQHDWENQTPAGRAWAEWHDPEGLAEHEGEWGDMWKPDPEDDEMLRQMRASKTTSWKEEYHLREAEPGAKETCATCSAFKGGECRMFYNSKVDEDDVCDEWSDTWAPETAADEKVALYLVHHGETKSNEKGKAQGWSNVDIDEDGKIEVRRDASRLEDLVDTIVASDLERTRETARIISDETGIPIEGFSKKYRTWDIGEYGGKPKNDVRSKLDEHIERPGEQIPGGESLNQFLDRVLPAVDALIRRADRGERIALVTHTKVLKAVKEHLKGRRGLAKKVPKWGGIAEVTGGEWSVVDPGRKARGKLKDASQTGN